MSNPKGQLNLDAPCHLVTEKSREAGTVFDATDMGAWLIVRDIPFTIELDVVGQQPERIAIFDGTALRSEHSDPAVADAYLHVLMERALVHAQMAQLKQSTR